MGKIEINSIDNKIYVDDVAQFQVNNMGDTVNVSSSYLTATTLNGAINELATTKVSFPASYHIYNGQVSLS